MAYTPIYTPKNFVDWGPPDLDANNLNDIEAAIVSLGNGLQTAAADTDTNTAAITTINTEISDINDLIDKILPDDSASGNPAVITDAFGGAVKSLKLTLNPIQSGSGTPSPSNVRPISGRTQSVVTRTGKNLVFKTISECNINASGVLESNNSYAIQVAYLKGGVTYTLTSDENRFVGGYFSSEPSIGSSTIDNTRIISNNTTITPASDCWVAFRTYNNYATPQIEVGSTATNYEPYTGATYTIDLDGTRYGGVVDFKTGVLSVSHLLVEYDGSEDETWTMYGTGSASAYAVIGRLPSVAEFTPNVLGVLTASYLENVSAQATWGNYDYFISQSNAMTGIDFVMGLKNISTSVSALKAYLAEHPLTICYKLATPVTVQLTPEEVTLLKGDNVIATDADNVDVEYKADIALYIAKQLGGNLGNRGAKSAPAEEPADDTKEEKTDDEIIEPVTKEAKK